MMTYDDDEVIDDDDDDDEVEDDDRTGEDPKVCLTAKDQRKPHSIWL